MPVLVDLRKVEDAFQLIEAGKESYESVGRKLGVPKPTLYRWHIKRLSREVEERRRALAELEGKLKGLRSDLDLLEGKYREKKERLEEDYRKGKSALEGEIQKFVEARAQLEGEIREAKERRSATLQELNQAISTKERLRKLGLEKTATLAKFIEEYELLGFDAQEVQKLSEWRKSLAKTGIDPDRLESFIRERGPLEKQLRSIEEEIGQGKTRLSILSKMEKDLQRNVRDIERVWRLLQQRYRNFACAYCGAVTPYELRRFEAQLSLARGEPLRVTCIRCGTPNVFNPFVILASLGLEILS